MNALEPQYFTPGLPPEPPKKWLQVRRNQLLLGGGLVVCHSDQEVLAVARHLAMRARLISGGWAFPVNHSIVGQRPSSPAEWVNIVQRHGTGGCASVGDHVRSGGVGSGVVGAAGKGECLGGPSGPLKQLRQAVKLTEVVGLGVATA